MNSLAGPFRQRFVAGVCKFTSSCAQNSVRTQLESNFRTTSKFTTPVPLQYWLLQPVFNEEYHSQVPNVYPSLVAAAATALFVKEQNESQTHASCMPPKKCLGAPIKGGKNRHGDLQLDLDDPSDRAFHLVGAQFLFYGFNF